VFQISHLARNFIPKFRTNFSPFEPAGRRREGMRGYMLQNPSITGQSSTSSTNSSTSSSMDEDSSSEEDTITDNRFSISGDDKEQTRFVSFNSLFPPMKDVYLTEPKLPKTKDLDKYKKYVRFGKLLIPPIRSNSGKRYRQRASLRSVSLDASADYGQDSYQCVELPAIKPKSLSIHKKYIRTPFDVCNGPTCKDFNTISGYVDFGTCLN